MPDFNRRDIIQLSILLLCVPAQYFFSTQWSPNPESKFQLTKWFVDTMELISDSYFSTDAWLHWCKDVIDDLMEEGTETEINETKNHLKSRKQNSITTGECPAIEVMTYRIEKGYFASSTEARSARSNDVMFSIGQVVKHKTLGYRGVIIGWDFHARAPEFWLRRMHPKTRQKKWRQMPNYAVLVDTRDRSDPQATYVPQENLHLVPNTEVRHPKLYEYFDEYVGQTYNAKGWLQKYYPED